MRLGRPSGRQPEFGGDVIALAYEKCVCCFGMGLCQPRHREAKPCKCVYRAVFRACYNRFKFCSDAPPRLPACPFRRNAKNGGATGNNSSAACGPSVRLRYGHPNAEYSADFLAIARRTLGAADSFRYRVFERHYLRRENWRVCTAQLGMDRGTFFHEVYRIEEALGRAFRETVPFALWPLDEYFRGTTRERTAAA
jgi:hypothetical protein